MADGWEEIGPGVLVAYRRGKVPHPADERDRLHVYQSARERPSNVCRPCVEVDGYLYTPAVIQKKYPGELGHREWLQTADERIRHTGRFADETPPTPTLVDSGYSESPPDA